LGAGDLSFCARRGRGRGAIFFSAFFHYCDRRTAANRAACFAVLLAVVATLLSGFANRDAASAQTPYAAILASGNAIVTGFSGAPLPPQIAQGANPGDKAFIDPNGPSARVFNLQAPGSPPHAQVIPSPVLFTVTAAQVGQVFGVVLDNATPPNMYVAATSAYGLPIVVPGPGGAPMRVHQGAPGATFMAGLFGPGGGPGSIWRIDGVSGAVSLFANVTLDGAANSGPALGGLAFDPVSNTLFAADRQTGMIHGFNLSGTQVGIYDHGVQGRQAAGAPPVPYDPSQHVAITSPQFSSDDPASWGYAPLSRLIFGLAVHSGRLYYAVAQALQVWSVSLAPDGSFGSDARLEVQPPEAEGATEISKIAFDNFGDMLLAERAAPTGDYTFVAVAQPGISSVLLYEPVPGTPGSWQPQPQPQQYAIGFPNPMTNANGGVAIGYGYDANGVIDQSSCGGFVWSTGEQLRNASDPNYAALLAASGPLDVNGLQGNDIGLVVPKNVPPTQSYFLDYDAQLDDPAVSGHLGDIAIPISCQQAALPGTPGPVAGQPEQPASPGLPGLPFLPPGFPFPPPPPAGFCPGGMPAGPNGQCACTPPGSPPGQVCCPIGSLPGNGGQCQSPCPGGQSDQASEALCAVGFQPTPGSNGDIDCLNGTDTGVFFPAPNQNLTPQQAATVFATCGSQAPWANQANCPTGWSVQPVQGVPGAQLCQPPSACPNGQPPQNGQCQQLCPSGELPFQVNGPTSQQIPNCPQPPPPSPPCTGPNCPTPPPCAGPNCPTPPPCTGPNCQTPPPCTGASCPPPQCAANTSPQPGFSCCQRGFFPAAGGGCQSSCPNGASDPQSLSLCMRGFNPVANGNGQYTCLNGSPASAQPGQPGGDIGCLAQAPFSNPADCPQGYAFKPDPNLGGAMLCQPTAQEKACRQQGMDVGLNGSCQQLCPPGEIGFPATQCCPNGMTPQPNGQCGPPPPPPTTPPNCSSGQTSYCTPLPLTGRTLCQLGQAVPGGCCPPGSMPASGGVCVTTGPSCASGSQTICCPTGQIPQPNGTCGPPTPPTTPPNCPSGQTPYCAPPQTNVTDCPKSQQTPIGACCPAGSAAIGSNLCVQTGSSCGSGSQTVCCPPGQSPNYATPGQCQPTPFEGFRTFCPAGTVRLADGECRPAVTVPPYVPGTSVPVTPPPPGTVIVPVQPPQLGCAEGYYLSGNSCLRLPRTCPGGGFPGPNGCGSATTVGVVPGTTMTTPVGVAPGTVTSTAVGVVSGTTTTVGAAPGTVTSVAVGVVGGGTPSTCPGGRSWRGCEPLGGITVTKPTTTTTTTVPTTGCKLGERGCDKGTTTTTTTNKTTTTIEGSTRRLEPTTPKFQSPPVSIERPLSPLSSGLNFGGSRSFGVLGGGGLSGARSIGGFSGAKSFGSGGSKSFGGVERR
jgi:hypothetical protein